mmetsp:Transcript_31581/g.69589  ORF Transcript_31581/g.69589 Transcript_31581/m.69589 type:complete len:271 (+) Transcript_31581:147-959(+)
MRPLSRSLRSLIHPQSLPLRPLRPLSLSRPLHSLPSLHYLKYLPQPYKLSLLQRLTLAPYLGIQSLLDPTNATAVAAFGDLTAGPALSQIINTLRSTVEGQQLLLLKPLITQESLDLPYLRQLPAGTFGRSYVSFMDKHGYSADGRAKVRFMLGEGEGAEEAYAMVRYRQVHDFWHVLSGLPPTVLGEVALKAFEFRVTGFPMAALGAALGPCKLQPAQIRTLYTQYVPWAVRAGGNMGRLMAFPYEKWLDKDLEEVRLELGVEPAPIVS